MAQQTKVGFDWATVAEAGRLKGSSIHTIDTRADVVSSQGINFIVKVADYLAKKPVNNATKSGPVVDPFAQPHTQELFFRQLSPTHSLIFNKFNLVPNHLIIVTNDFEKQQTPVSFNDLDAMWSCVAQLRCLAFFNGGRRAGASQPHKHAQIVPLPLESGILSAPQPQDPVPPIHATLEQAWRAKNPAVGEIITAPSLPFLHWFSYWDDESKLSTSTIHGYYTQMLDKVKHFQATDPAFKPSPDEASTDLHYSLLLTTRWIFVIPRSTDLFGNVSVNSLGYAGTMFAKATDDLDKIKSSGPVNILKHCGYASAL